MSIKYIFIALGVGFLVTTGSVLVPGSYQSETGNVCEKTDSNPQGLCIEALPTGGFPFPYLYDAGGVSVQHQLGAEDQFRILPFLANLLVYCGLCYLLLAWLHKPKRT